MDRATLFAVVLIPSAIFAALALAVACLSWPGGARLRLAGLGLALLAAMPVALIVANEVGLQSPWPLTYRSVQATAAVTDPMVDAISAYHSRVGNDWRLWVWIVLAYAAGVVWRLGLHIGRLWSLHRLAQRAVPVEQPIWCETLKRLNPPEGLRLLQSCENLGPLTWGFRRPVILLDAPTLAQHSSVEAVLRHELAHIRRHDWLVHAAVGVLGAVLWFVPAVRQLSGRLSLAQEQRADAAAAQSVGRLPYAAQLLALAKGRNAPCTALPMLGAQGDLAIRIKSLVGDPRKDGGLAEVLMAAGLLAGWFALFAVSLPEAPTVDSSDLSSPFDLAPLNPYRSEVQ